MPDIEEDVNLFTFVPEALEVLWRYYDFVVVAFDNLHPQFPYLLQKIIAVVGSKLVEYCRYLL
jgi:hypothetical protein